MRSSVLGAVSTAWRKASAASVKLAQEIVRQTEVIIGRHTLGIESRGAGRSARACANSRSGSFAMAALRVEVGILGRESPGASQGFDGFFVLPDRNLRLRQFEQQVGILGIGRQVLLRGGDTPFSSARE
jgi:hypothetical protein